MEKDELGLSLLSNVPTSTCDDESYLYEFTRDFPNTSPLAFLVPGGTEAG
jgi:hypothetical protein